MHDKRITPIADRFWPKVDRSGECWVWTASKMPDGYGQIGVEGHRPKRAHRVSWELHFGPIPPGMLVLHRCDNPPCVRPDHLFLGTSRDNTLDMVGKRRHGSQRYPERLPSGVNHWRHRPDRQRLTDDQVKSIRTRYAAGGVSLVALAREYHVSEASIRMIVKRKSYRHL
jgi:hypothetical protein